MKILIIDDDELVLKTMSFKLKKEGYEIFTASLAPDALQIIKHQKLDLIISDIMMPYMSGLELLNIVKSNFFNNVPVILMSALDEPEVISTSMDLGANNYFVKPIDFKYFTPVVRSYVN